MSPRAAGLDCLAEIRGGDSRTTTGCGAGTPVLRVIRTPPAASKTLHRQPLRSSGTCRRTPWHPVGNSRQNLHPSWINKLPSAPPSFGHDGAAPLAEVGIQLRGGVLLGKSSRLTYSGYVGNGPKLEGEDGEIHAVETGGFAGNPDDEYVYGGRVSFLPVPALEIAFSGALGDVSIVESDGADLEGDPKRNYTVYGADASYRRGAFNLRAEYVRQEVDEAPLSVAPEKAEWETWYAQGAYGFGRDRWEGVVRYTDFTSPHAEDSQEQWAFGVNYLLTPSAMIKFAYESNSGETGEPTDDDRWTAQVAYGY